MFFKSIRFKIVSWYALILALALILFTILVYENLRKTLIDDLDNMLQLKAEGVSESIDTYWEVEKNEGIAAGAPREVFSKINNLNFNKIAQRWVKEQSNDPELLGIIVSIFGPNGVRIAASEETSGIIYLHEWVMKEVLSGRSRFENREFQKNASGEVETMRVFLMPVVEDKELVYIVEVASPMTIFQNALNNTRLSFYILLPMMIILSAIAGWLLAALIIRPLRRIVGNMHRITAENLKLRIKTPDTKDEIRELIDTFNTMLEKLDKSFSSQAQLIQDMSHEFRTPLTIMRGEMEVALKKTRSREEYIEVLKSCREEIIRLSLLVENLLTLSRIDNHETSMNIKYFDVTSLINGIISEVRLLAENKKVIITWIGEEKIFINGDETQLRRAFLNIIDNAIKYTDEGGKIDVNISTAEGIVRMVVADSGIGIMPENIPLIFNRFFRADKSRTGEGYGLGLSISKSIIKTHKGTISIESEPGRGTRAIIVLPEGKL
jgi:two-component system, OmpR family, sensor kinase